MDEFDEFAETMSFIFVMLVLLSAFGIWKLGDLFNQMLEAAN